jgi:molecular chaperone GrpE (heat shock protein)
VILRDWVLLANQGQGAADPQAMTSTLEGLYKRLGQLLQQEGLHTLEVTGEPFDGDRQQVMDTRATNDPALDDTVCSTLRPGYLFQARLYRPQQVILYQYKDQGVS